MKKYKSLNKNIFNHKEYSLVPIRYEDRLDIMRWRNEQIFHLRQEKLLTEETQEKYFNETISKIFVEDKPNQILFSLLKNDKCIGYGGLVHINWLDKNTELSFIMDTSLEKNDFKNIWNVFLHLIEEVAFSELKLHKIFTYAYDLRPQLYPIFENFGFKKEAELIDHKLIGATFINVIIHSKINGNGNKI